MNQKKIKIFCLFISLFFIASCDLQPNNGQYVVSFFQDDESSESIDILVNSGTTIEEPEDPFKEGYTFMGWFRNRELYDFTAKVKENFLLFAEWQINEYDISYTDINGNSIETYTYVYNTDISEFDIVPNGPELEGHIFAGWDTDKPNLMPADDLIISPLYFEGEEIVDTDSDETHIDSSICHDENLLFFYSNYGSSGINKIVTYKLNDSNSTRDILNPNHGVRSSFGYTIKVSGDYIIVGDNLYNDEQGIIYVYKFSDSSYMRTITGSNTENYDQFGTDIYVYDDYIITKICNTYNGYDTSINSIYIYSFSDEAFERIIEDPYQDQSSGFGDDIYVQNGYLIVNIPSKYSGYDNPFNNNQTITLIYKLNDSTYYRTITNDQIYVETTLFKDNYIILGATDLSDEKGLVMIYDLADVSYERIITSPVVDGRTSLYLHDKYLILSSDYYNGYQGILYVYSFDDNDYERIIIGSETEEESGFGSQVYFQDDYMIVRSDTLTKGKVYVYKLSNSSYERIISETDIEGYTFGYTINVEGDFLVVDAAKGRFNNDRGRLYIYKLSDDSYRRVIDEEMINIKDHFGFGTQIYNEYLLTASIDDDTHQGTLYIYKLTDDTYKKHVIYNKESNCSEYDIDGYNYYLDIVSNTVVLTSPCDNNERGRIYIFTLD